ncbi:hypothetical protein HHX47_DHR7000389 [Lentinula edodes]|nr:hypothetical protein HHX47_DHR7000389 [Lentinula edodes]
MIGAAYFMTRTGKFKRAHPLITLLARSIPPRNCTVLMCRHILCLSAPLCTCLFRPAFHPLLMSVHTPNMLFPLTTYVLRYRIFYLFNDTLRPLSPINSVFCLHPISINSSHQVIYSLVSLE